MTQRGVGVMIGMLSDTGETAEAVRSAIGKTIKTVEKRDETNVGRHNYADALVLTFEDGSALTIYDGGQSCCEHRYMVVDADLAYFAGAQLRSVELWELPNASGDYDEHEARQVLVKTSKGDIDAVTHNVHNGYYGGFWIQATFAPAVS